MKLHLLLLLLVPVMGLKGCVLAEDEEKLEYNPRDGASVYNQKLLRSRGIIPGFQKVDALPFKELLEDVKNFIVEGYEVLDLVKGDLNFDEYDDIILILKERNEPTSPFSEVIGFENPPKRPLFILLGTENGGFEVAYRNDNLIYCHIEGGMYGDLYRSVEILPGYFMVKHTEGSVHRWNRKTAFVYEPDINNWYLFADIEEFSNIERESGIKYFLKKPGLQEEILFSEFNIYSEDSFEN